MTVEQRDVFQLHDAFTEKKCSNRMKVEQRDVFQVQEDLNKAKFSNSVEGLAKRRVPTL